MTLENWISWSFELNTLTMKYFATSLVLCVFFISTSSAVDFNDCNESSDGTVNSITVSGCSDSDDSCPLKQGTNVTLTVDFSSSKFND